MFFGISDWYFDNYDNLQNALIEKYLELNLNDFSAFCEELEILVSPYDFKELVKGVKIFSTLSNSQSVTIMDIVRELDNISYIEVHHLLSTIPTLFTCSYNYTIEKYEYRVLKN